jgi:serine/threonine protein kinase/tetratricopeptide (TPR) repeat protein
MSLAINASPGTVISTQHSGGKGSFAEIVSLCENFTGDWQPKSQEAPGQTGAWKPALINSYLGRVEEAARPTLLRNLLVIEIERRRATGEQPQIEEYLERFPQFTGMIREAFLHLSHQALTTRRDRQPGKATEKPLAVRHLGEYELLRELGRGGMGVVYAAVHRQRGTQVALKTLPTVDGDALHRFKQEFRALADINHPNLIGLHTLEADGCHWFFTMDLLEGEDFLRHVRPDDKLDEARLRSALAQLVVGVMALHGHHIVHRDLKPSNVMVTGEGRVILLDFGLVVELSKRETTEAGEIAGTPRYMAPEQAAGSAVTPACDWYAVGVMLYEALTGQPPFGGSVRQVLQDKQRRDVPPFPAGLDLPTDLAELCLKLLARDPKQRPDALAIAKVIAAQAGTVRTPTAGWHLVGRESQVAALKAACQTFQEQRQPLTVFISGRSGEGKTTLADHFLQPLYRDRRLIVLSGRCYDRESVPFKALDSLIDALATFLRGLTDWEIKPLLPPDIAVLAQVFPVLQRVNAIGVVPRSGLAALEEQQIRQRAFLALRELLRRLSVNTPLVLFVDDLQWGDADSAMLLFEVLRPPEAPAVLFLGSFRSDEAATSPFLTAWEELKQQHNVTLAHRDIKVGPLSVEDCTALVISLLERDTELVRRRAMQFHAETGGNAYLLIELVGCFDPETDSFESLEMHEVLARKLGRLPAEAGHLLDVVAVSGQALALNEASRTAGHELLPVATLTRMRNERLVRLVGSEEHPLVDTYHDRVRETVLARMETGTRQTLHLTLAEVIEKEVGGVSAERIAALESGNPSAEDDKALPRVYDLAYHYDAAGRQRQAWVYGLLAAEQARRQSALEVAANNFALAKRNATEAPSRVRYRIAAGGGEALMLLARYDEAVAELHAAHGITNNPVELATVEGYLGEIALKRGWAGESTPWCESALRRLGTWVPQSKLGWVSGLLNEVVTQGLHSLFPGRLHRQTATSELNLAGKLYSRLAYTYYFQSSFKNLWAMLAGLNHVERLPSSPALGFAYATFALHALMLGMSSRGQRYLERSLQIRQEFNDLWGIAHSYNFHGIVLCIWGRYEESITKLDTAYQYYGKTGDQYERNANRMHWVLAHERMGNLALALEEVRYTFHWDIPHGDDNTGHFCIGMWSSLTSGKLPFAELRSCFRALPDNIPATAMFLTGESRWHLFHGRTEEAVAACEKAWNVVKRTLVINHLTSETLPCLATALCRHADAVAYKDRRQAEHIRQRAFRYARWGVWLNRQFPMHLPYALRELSLMYAHRRQLHQALQKADQSCALAHTQKARYEHAQSLLVRGQIAHRLGRPEAAEQIQSAEAALEEIERPVREWQGY